MDGVEKYRKIIKQILNQYYQSSPVNGEIEMQTIFDEKQDHYQLIAMGWEKKRRVHGCVIHINIKGDKVRLQHNSTDTEIAEMLIKEGIPTKQIVLGFQPEYYRQHTEFAIN